ncbi:hypothetical protein HPB49_025710 [Dermacentor silvarum]|nr:hypothetical protein HPB49_025710 [Dermacentor silvarum]
MDIERLYAIGKDMGLAGAVLRDWVDAERVIARDLCMQAHNDQRANIELEEIRLQVEERVLQLKLKLQEQTTSLKVRDSGLPLSGDAAVATRMDGCTPHKFCHHLMKRDMIPTPICNVLSASQRLNCGLEITLSLCLTGEALAVISRLDSTSALDYDQLKVTLSIRFRYTAEGYREKLRKARQEKKETGLQYASRLAGHFDRWMEMARVEKIYDLLRDLIISEQFMKRCSPPLRLFLMGRSCEKLSTLAQNSDCFLEAQDIYSLRKDKSYKDNAAEISRQTESAKRPPTGHTQCFLRNKTLSSCIGVLVSDEK